MSSAISNRIIAAFLWAVALIPAASVAQTPIPVGEAFRLGVSRDAEQGLRLDWTIKPGYYLYRDKIAVRTADGQPLPVTTDAGERKDDPTFGPTEIYRDKAQAGISRADLPGSATTVDVVYQGCAEKGICYPPVTKTIDLATSAVRKSVEVDAGRGAATSLWAQAPEAPTPAVKREAETGGANPALTGGLAAMLASFLGFGLLLALRPSSSARFHIRRGAAGGCARHSLGDILGRLRCRCCWSSGGWPARAGRLLRRLVRHLQDQRAQVVSRSHHTGAASAAHGDQGRCHGQ